jgi:uncharacterized protein
MATKPGHMSLEVVERVFESISRSSATAVDFSIHGGEPLLHTPSYFRDLFTLQRQYLRGRVTQNSIQTNGTLLDETFIAAYEAIVGADTHLGLGLSLDGPQAVHDGSRRYRKTGGGSFHDVMRGLDLLHRHGIQVAILAVAPLPWPDCGRDLYHFFKALPNVHLVDVLVPSGDSFPDAPEGSLTKMYTELFDAWFFDGNASFEVRFFCSIIQALLTGSGTLCTFQEDCVINNIMLSIVPDGDTSFCDSFTEVKLGNIWTHSVDELAARNHPERMRFSVVERRRIEACLFCKWFNVCHGGCPAAHMPGSRSPHHFCSEYQRIFSHVDARLREIDIAASHGLGEENLTRLVNPRLSDHLRKLRYGREHGGHQGGDTAGGTGVMKQAAPVLKSQSAVGSLSRKDRPATTLPAAQPAAGKQHIGDFQP